MKQNHLSKTELHLHLVLKIGIAVSCNLDYNGKKHWIYWLFTLTEIVYIMKKNKNKEWDDSHTRMAPPIYFTLYVKSNIFMFWSQTWTLQLSCWLHTEKFRSLEKRVKKSSFVTEMLIDRLEPLLYTEINDKDWIAISKCCIQSGKESFSYDNLWPGLNCH